jgi:hypothetical protein
MAIPDIDMKVLWGRAAGICSNPTCKVDLTLETGSSQVFNVGEMAHIIARNEGGPRGVTGGGADTYQNLILLCPTCHRTIDKAPPGTYPEEMLHDWKRAHENAIREAGKEKRFLDINALKHFCAPILAENKSIWANLGPNSDAAKNNPNSNIQKVWELRKLDKIIPNNKIIQNTIQANLELLDQEMLDAFLLFKLHASSFESSQYDRLDQYTLFPIKFAELFLQP